MNSRVHVQSFGNGKQDHEIYTALNKIILDKIQKEKLVENYKKILIGM